MLIKVSQLITISLLWLVGCSGEEINQNSSDSSSSDVSSSPSFLGCWQGLSADGNIEEKHYFDFNNQYKVTRQRKKPQPQEGIFDPRVDSVSQYSGKWSSDGKTIQVQANGLGTFLLDIVSGYQLKFVQSSGDYALSEGEQSPTSFLKCSE
jgi:hypothetical protein